MRPMASNVAGGVNVGRSGQKAWSGAEGVARIVIANGYARLGAGRRGLKFAVEFEGRREETEAGPKKQNPGG